MTPVKTTTVDWYSPSELPSLDNQEGEVPIVNILIKLKGRKSFPGSYAPERWTILGETISASSIEAWCHYPDYNEMEEGLYYKYKLAFDTSAKLATILKSMLKETPLEQKERRITLQESLDCQNKISDALYGIAEEEMPSVSKT